MNDKNEEMKIDEIFQISEYYYDMKNKYFGLSIDEWEDWVKSNVLVG